jgi:hypothetical protein
VAAQALKCTASPFTPDTPAARGARGTSSLNAKLAAAEAAAEPGPAAAQVMPAKMEFMAGLASPDIAASIGPVVGDPEPGPGPAASFSPMAAKTAAAAERGGGKRGGRRRQAAHKIILLGDARVGKSALLRRLIPPSNRLGGGELPAEYEPTSGMVHQKHAIPVYGNDVSVQVWDCGRVCHSVPIATERAKRYIRSSALNDRLAPGYSGLGPRGWRYVWDDREGLLQERRRGAGMSWDVGTCHY